LFADLASKVTLIDAVANPPIVYEFASDGVWNRILFGQKDIYIKEFFNSGPGQRPVEGPAGLDISASRLLYVADRANERVLLARFDAASRTLSQVASVSDPMLRGVSDVAWDGQDAPLTTDFFYALNGSGWVSYWGLVGSSATLQFTFGQPGSGTGQFKDPLGVCVGRAVTPGGGSVQTKDFYVADAGNRRIVWLQRPRVGTSYVPSWVGSITLPDNGVPADCTVDHFGNVIVVDSLNSRLLKYTWNLTYLDQYGTFGIGAGNHNTFAHPHAVHAPFGIMTAGGGATVWYGEGRILTAETWGAESGAREHYLGLALSGTSGPDTSGGLTTFGYRVTDHAYHTVLVKSLNNTIVRRLNLGQSLMPSGSSTIVWDGLKDDGTYAAPGYHYFTIQAVSAYGCALNAWCNQFLTSATFWYNGRTDCGPPDPAPPLIGNLPPVERQQCLTPPIAESEPTVLVMHQRVVGSARALARISASTSVAVDPIADGSGTLTQLVRQYGVRGLTFGIPRGLAGTPITVRIYTTAGRLVRILLSERLDPGFYEVAWDGMDERGRSAAPGVYFAVLTAGSERQTQRLILRQPQ
jgi:flagellar hook assembly protein FlgD